MDLDNVLFTGLTVLGLFIIADSIWFTLMPPYGDEIQGYGLITIGFFALLMVYILALYNKKPTH
ncbi:MAG: hypothetical protein Q7V05_03465 [Methanoregula sp.]|nr:hypothetical protein [Methanoregula sp.]